MIRSREAPSKPSSGSAFAAGERYVPDNMPDMTGYEPTDRGLEARIREKLAALRARDREAGDDGKP